MDGHIGIRNSNQSGWTLVELMIVVGIIGMLAALAIPNFIRARAKSNESVCINNLRQIDSGGQGWATANRKQTGDTYTLEDIKDYFQRSMIPQCPCGGQYGPILKVGETPTCTIEGHVLR